MPVSDKEVTAFIEENNSECCNYPLYRKFLKKHSKKALNLFKFGLDEDPTNTLLLNGLGLLSNFSNITQEVIHYNVKSLLLESDLRKFKYIAEEYCSWYLNGYEAIPELKKQFSANKPKLDLILSVEKDFNRTFSIHPSCIN